MVIDSPVIDKTQQCRILVGKLAGAGLSRRLNNSLRQKSDDGFSLEASHMFQMLEEVHHINEDTTPQTSV